VAQEPQAPRPLMQGGRPYPPPGESESFWPAQLTILAAIGLQFALPPRIVAGPPWLIPGLEALLLIGLVFATPNVLEHEHPKRRRLALSLIAFVSAANIYALVTLIKDLLHHHVENGDRLLFSGVLIWLTNFLIFCLWYWEMDRGGPGKRAAGNDEEPDFLFPQMNDDAIFPQHWRPRFIDYMFVSLTNATAFSPTDTMPLTPWAKSVMGVQSVASLVTIGLIVSRAVNILA